MKYPKATPRKGAAVVEFAILAPVFVLMVLGMIEVGRGVGVQHSLQNAARSGCRAAVIEGVTLQDVNDRVADVMDAAGVSTYSVTVLPDPLSSAAQGDPITVIVTANFGDVSLLPTPKYLTGKTLTGSCSFPRE